MSASAGSTIDVAPTGPDVVTVTCNPAVDQTVWIPGFRAGAVNRVAREELSPGGKGVNVAAVLAELRLRVSTTGFLGSDNASLFESFLRHRAIDDQFVRVAGSTRTGVKIVDDEAGSTTDINFPGIAPSDAELRRFIDRFTASVEGVGWVVLAGSLPPGVPDDLYRRLTEVAHEAGAAVAVDTSGTALVHALTAQPDLVKPNHAEIEELTGRALPDTDAVIAAADELRARGIATVVVSMGADGAVFVGHEGAVFAHPVEVKVESTVGAGDAMVAGTIAALHRGLALAEAAALATACSAVAISRVGPHLDVLEVERLAAQVNINALEPRTGSYQGRTP